MIVYFGIVHKSSCLLIYLLREMRREKIIEMMERLTRSLHKQQKLFSGK